jgi:hypothetical protein
MRHLPRFKQLRGPQPVEAALCERPPPGIEVPCHRLRVRPADAERVRPEALVAHGLQILRVRVEHVLPAHVTGGIEEREAHPDRDFEQALLLAIGLVHEGGVDGGELVGARQPSRVLAQVAQRLPETLELERRDVDQPRRRTARALERREQLVDGAELRAACDDTCLLQLVDEGVEVDARPAADVGRGGEDPERREAEREDRPELDDVSRPLPHGELLRGALDLARRRALRTLDTAHELHGDAEQVLGRRLVQARAAHQPGEQELRGLVHGPADERGHRAHDPLGEGDEEARRSRHVSRPSRRSRRRRSRPSRRSSASARPDPRAPARRLRRRRRARARSTRPSSRRGL